MRSVSKHGSVAAFERAVAAELAPAALRVAGEDAEGVVALAPGQAEGARVGDHRGVVRARLQRRHVEGDALLLAELPGAGAEPGVRRDPSAEDQARDRLGLAGGDLTQPFVERGEREFNELGQALNQMRRSFKQSIAGVQGASREFSSATKRVHESSGKITEDAIEQSQAIRQTVTSIDAMATSSSSVQK